MPNFTVNILGCGSATPSLRHLPSAQIINHNDRLFMVDCGEGSQLQIRRMKLKFSMIRHIFISHLHGDHMLGLPGLLSTLSLHEIGGQVHVYMFDDGIEWIRRFMELSYHHATIDVVFHPLKRESAVIYDDPKLTVETIPLYHRVPCVGFIFREKAKPRKILGDMVNHFGVPNYLRDSLKSGADYITPEGEIIANARLTTDPDPAYSYAYCSDTMFRREVVEAVRGVSTIYHESTYADDRQDKARDRWHSTARQAGIVAREAGADQLIIGHFSKSYQDDSIFLKEALEEFPNVVLAYEGLTIPVI